MATTIMRQEAVTTFNQVNSDPTTIAQLGNEDESEVLDFLAARPAHTVLMAGLIRDNGLVSPQNRGAFYACRDHRRELEGVALIGHLTIIESRNETSLSTFARLARRCPNTRLIRGERETIHRFWTNYTDGGSSPRLICGEYLLEQRETLRPVEPIENLRPATLNDLDQVMKINAAMALEEGGVSPLDLDPEGFCKRTTRRIEQGRVWTWPREGKLVFKADVISETPEAIYLEGVYVDPEERRKGFGHRCLSQLGSILLSRSESICLTINERNQNVLPFYARAGYKFHSHYETIYLR
jgi:uncharacterized protein